VGRSRPAANYADVDAAIPEGVARWLAADAADRPAIQRDLQLQMCPAAIDDVAQANAVYCEARNVLSPRQYRQAMSMGETTAIPTPNIASIIGATTRRSSVRKPQSATTRRSE
jgi:hypothetical protein